MLPEKEVIINNRYTKLVTSIPTTSTPESENSNNLTPIKVENLLKTSDYFDRFNYNYLYRQILPKNCKYVDVSSTGVIIAIEEDPCVRTVRFNLNLSMELKKLQMTGKLEEYGFSELISKENGNSLYNSYSLSLSFPYIVYLFLLKKVNPGYSVNIKIYYRLAPITSLFDYLLSVNLLNVNDINNLCLNENYHKSENISEICSDFINHFWFKGFNGDYFAKYQSYKKNSLIGDPFTWAYNSRIDPSFIFSVKWHKLNTDLITEIKNLKNYRTDNYDGVEFNDVISPFISNRPKEDTNIIESSELCLSICLESGYILSVGDEIEYNNKKYYVYSFMYNINIASYRSKNPNAVESIKLEDVETSEVIEVKFSSGVFLDLMKKFEKKNKNKIKSIEVDGKTISISDLIELDENTHLISGYYEVTNIRKSRDGNYEIKIGQYYYIAKNLKVKSIFTVDDITLDGIKIEKDKSYLFLCVYNTDFRIYRIMSYCKFHTFSSTGGSIYLSFVDKTENMININLNNPNIRIKILPSNSLTDNFSDVSPLRIGTELLFGNNKVDFKNKIVIPDNCDDEGYLNNICDSIDVNDPIVIPDNCDDEGYLNNICDSIDVNDPKDIRNRIESLAKQVLQDNNTLMIPGMYQDICFSVGDLVVSSNWIIPEEMLKIKRIEGFKVNIENLSIDIVVSDLEEKENILSIPYIKFNNFNMWRGSGKICVGKVRKISLEYNGIKAGCKLIAKVTRIPGFPKKDINQIIAFITDTNTPYPLILCSNYLTLWANKRTLEKFNIIPTESKKWSKYQISTPDVNKIKNQLGDMYSNNDSLNPYIGYLNQFNDKLLNLKLMDFNSRIRSSVTNTITSSKIVIQNISRFGYLEPRLSNEELLNTVVETGMPNFHGGYFLYPNAPFNIRKNWEDYV